MVSIIIANTINHNNNDTESLKQLKCIQRIICSVTRYTKLQYNVLPINTPIADLCISKIINTSILKYIIVFLFNNPTEPCRNTLITFLVVTNFSMLKEYHVIPLEARVTTTHALLDVSFRSHFKKYRYFLVFMQKMF